jgi:hypothetical protein
MALGAASLAGAAQANRPLNTDTADTITPHRCQFEPYLLLDRSRGSPTEHATVLQLNCGVSESTQLGLAVSRASAGDESARQLTAAGKTKLVEIEEGQTGVAVAYGWTAAKPAGSAWSSDAGFVYLIATRQLAPNLLGHVNLGAAHSRLDRQDRTTWAAAFEWTVTPGLVVSGETYGDDRSRPWVGTGLWWGLRDNFSVNLSLGVQTANPRVRQVTAGFNLEF